MIRDGNSLDENIAELDFIENRIRSNYMKAIRNYRLIQVIKLLMIMLCMILSVFSTSLPVILQIMYAVIGGWAVWDLGRVSDAMAETKRGYQNWEAWSAANRKLLEEVLRNVANNGAEEDRTDVQPARGRGRLEAGDGVTQGS